jgi:hypothetical protein
LADGTGVVSPGRVTMLRDMIVSSAAARPARA